jgi:hypothetical protein
VRGYVLDHLADPGAVLVVDETGDLKKGTSSGGVQRQYSGTAGRIENCQVTVFLTYASAGGHAFVDRRLYLPESWASDAARREQAGVPEVEGFATKPHLAAQMITDVVAAGAPARWAAGDEVYGADPHLRTTCRRLGLSYVLAIGCNRAVPTGAEPISADEATALVPDGAWVRMSCGDGSKGRRWYSWAVVELGPEPDGPDLGSGHHALLAPQRPDRGAGVVPLLDPTPGRDRGLGAGRGPPVDGRGDLPGRQGPRGPGRAPGPPLGLLAPVDHPGAGDEKAASPQATDPIYGRSTRVCIKAEAGLRRGPALVPTLAVPASGI